MNKNKDNERPINYRPLLAAAVGFVCGIHFAVKLGVGGSLQTKGALAVFAAVAALAVIASVFGAVFKNKWLFVVPLFLLLGVVRVQLFAPYADEPLASSGAEAQTVSGTVISVDTSGESSRFVLSSVTADGMQARHRLLLSAPAETEERITVGDNVTAVCTGVRLPETAYGGYNERLQRLASGVSLKAYSNSIDVVSHGSAPLRSFFSGLRANIEARIDGAFGRSAPLVKGFLLGLKSDIPDDTYSYYVTGGIAHVLTLSGFHVGLFTAILFRIFTRRKRILRAVCTALALLVYCGLTGFAPSLVRASLMCLCAVAAPAFLKRADGLSSLSLAALAILVSNPFKLYSLGFVLTFAATLGILLIFSFGRSEGGGALKKAGELAAMTLGASAATVLITAAAFGHFYPYNIIANLVCVPIISAAVTMCMVITALAFILPGFAAFAALVPNALFDLVEWLLALISRLPYAAMDTIKPSALSCVLALLCLFSVSAYVLRPIKTRIKYGACVFLLFTASLIADIILI